MEEPARKKRRITVDEYIFCIDCGCNIGDSKNQKHVRIIKSIEVEGLNNLLGKIVTAGDYLCRTCSLKVNALSKYYKITIININFNMEHVYREGLPWKSENQGEVKYV